jgi:DNA invertase Pin-like site-specific DNA recombinase
MNIGYGFRRTEAALKQAGAERVWIDLSKERTERADMLRIGLKAGDTLIVLSKNDLGGSARANRIIRDNLTAMGVTVAVVAPDTLSKPMGRPRKFDPTPEQAEQIKEIWLCWHHTGAYKLRRAAEIMGHSVSRGQLNHRFGNMSKPKE